MCLWLCTTVVYKYNTTQNGSDNLPFYLQTNTIAQMLSIIIKWLVQWTLPSPRVTSMPLLSGATSDSTARSQVRQGQPNLRFQSLGKGATLDLAVVHDRSARASVMKYRHPIRNKQECSSLQQASPLRELTCHMGSHSVTCHPAEVIFPSLFSQPITAGTRSSDPGGTQGWADVVGWLLTKVVYPPLDESPIPVLTGLNVEQLRWCDKRCYYSAKLPTTTDDPSYIYNPVHRDTLLTRSG